MSRSKPAVFPLLILPPILDTPSYDENAYHAQSKTKTGDEQRSNVGSRCIRVVKGYTIPPYDGVARCLVDLTRHAVVGDPSNV
jgi:hypothetical protein